MLSKASLAAANRTVKGELIAGEFQLLELTVTNGAFGDERSYAATGTPFRASLAVHLDDDEQLASRVQGRTVYVLTSRNNVSLTVGELIRRNADSQAFEVVGVLQAPPLSGRINSAVLVAMVQL